MSALRILHVVFSSRLAGSERYCADLANRQAELGHEVHVAGTSGAAIAGALGHGVRFHGCRMPLFRGWFLRRLVGRLEPDVCHGHLSGACKALGRLPARRRSVATLHVGYKAHQHGRLGGVICVNRAQAQRLEDFGGMARRIPNWLPATTARTKHSGLRAELGIAENIFLIGAIGRLHPSKGMDVLVRAFRASAPAEAALVIVGEGPQRAELERLAAGDRRIHLPGFREDVTAALGELDLFVSPSREETFGLAILEAMGAGVPVIATDVEGPGEYLLDHPVVLVEPESVEGLATAMGAAHEIFQRTGLPRIAYDLSEFDPRARVGDVMRFYAEVAGAGRFAGAGREVRAAVAT